MANPIKLCCVDFDNTYKHVRHFKDPMNREYYFEKATQFRLEDYLTVRSPSPDGGVRTSIKIDVSIDALRAKGVNYVVYNKYSEDIPGSIDLKFVNRYYAFIVDMKYTNRNNTELFIETDVYQTWMETRPYITTFVEREHEKFDLLFNNLVPEKFSVTDFEYEDLAQTTSQNWGYGYLIAASEPSTSTEYSEAERGKLMSGIYQGMYFYYLESPNEINDLISRYESSGLDAIQSITLIPRFNLGLSMIGEKGLLESTTIPAERTITTGVRKTGIEKYTFGGYVPKNKKLFTAPFVQMILTDGNGNEGVYNLEDFGESFDFVAYGDISTNPSIIVMPKDYKGLKESANNGLTLSAFPQCSFNSDTYKLWLAKNQFGTAVGIGTGIATIAGGIVAAAANPVAGAATIGYGASKLLGIINEDIKASKEPNRTERGTSGTNIISALGKYRPDFQIRKIKRHTAESIDDYFTMYGYQSNRLKVPNHDSRPYFNYLQIPDIPIPNPIDAEYGVSIPHEDVRKIKEIYRNGLTLWHEKAKIIGDYSVDNSPK